MPCKRRTEFTETSRRHGGCDILRGPTSLAPSARMPDTQSPREPLARAMTHALAYLDKLDTASVSATAPLGQLRSRLGRPLAEDGVAASRGLHDLVADVHGGLIASAGGGFF